MAWLMAKIYDGFMAKSEEACLAQWRRDLLAGVSGRVLEVGSGTGVNLAHYPDTVSELVLTEPDPHMRSQLEAKLRNASLSFATRVEDVALEALPFDDATFDVVVSTLVLCSVRDPVRAVEEARRVLKPGGELRFLEHVAAHDRPDRLRWQRIVEPVWKRAAGNCHLTRRTAETISAAGFEVGDVYAGEHAEGAAVGSDHPCVALRGRPSRRAVARHSRARCCRRRAENRAHCATFGKKCRSCGCRAGRDAPLAVGGGLGMGGAHRSRAASRECAAKVAQIRGTSAGVTRMCCKNGADPRDLG